MTNNEQTQPSPPRRQVVLYVLVPVVMLLGFGAYQHWRTYADAAETQQQQQNFVTHVRVATAKREDAAVQLTLPGQTEAFDTANFISAGDGLCRGTSG